MTSVRIAYAVRMSLLAATGCFVASTQSSAQMPEAAQPHIAAATAGSDMLGALGLCRTASPAPAPSFMDNYRSMSALPPLEPMQVFDNLYFLGSKWTTAWAVKTSAGIVIIDAMNNDDEAEKYIDAGLKKLGLNPADIRYVVVSHGHGDHYGGASYLKKKFSPRIVMSEIDWKLLEETVRDPLFGTKRNPLFGLPPERDQAVQNEEVLTLGDTQLKFYVIPGHTLGTLATVFTVYDQGKPHRVVAWGGTAYNFGPIPDRLQLYADTTRRYIDVMKQEGTDIFLSNHVSFDSAELKMAVLKERKTGQENPFVVGPGAVQRFLTVLGECALATKAVIEARAGK